MTDIDIEIKGKELIEKFMPYVVKENHDGSGIMWRYAKACAIICVDEILNIHKNKEGMYIPVSEVALNYWEKVRAYIEGSK